MIVSFLYPFNIRGIEAPHLWFFLEQMQKIKEDIIYIGSKEYFCDHSESNRWEVNDYKMPKISELNKIKKYIISKDVFDELKEENRSPLDSWKYLMNDVYRPLEIELEKILLEIMKENKIDVILASCNCPSLDKLSKKYDIPVIYNEVGGLRDPLFTRTMYFDFSGVNANCEFERRYLKFKDEIKNKNFNFLGFKELRNLISTEMFNYLLEKQKYNDPKYKLGLALQIEEDSIVISYSKGYMISDLLILASENYDKNKVLIRAHPGSQFNLDEKKNRYGIIDDKVFNFDFWINSETIMSINSNMLFESLFFEKKAVCLGEAPFESFIAKTLKEKDDIKIDYEKLEFYTIAYLIPYKYLYDLEYIRFRLSNPSEVEIYNYNLKLFFASKVKKTKINEEEMDNLIKFKKTDTDEKINLKNNLEEVKRKFDIILQKSEILENNMNYSNRKIEEIGKGFNINFQKMNTIENNVNYNNQKIEEIENKFNLSLQKLEEIERTIKIPPFYKRVISKIFSYRKYFRGGK